MKYRKWKRAISAVLCLSAFCSLFTACEGPETKETVAEPMELMEIWH